MLDRLFKVAQLSTAVSAFQTLTVDSQQGNSDDAAAFCNGNTFCERTREFKLDAESDGHPNLSYSLAGLDLVDDVVHGGKKYQGTLSFANKEACEGDFGYLASDLTLNVSIYQEGILRVDIEEEDPDSWRFRISEEDLPVVWDQLIPVENAVQTDLTDAEGTLLGYSFSIEAGAANNEESVEHKIFLDPFTIESTIGGVLTAVVNPSATLYFENQNSDTSISQNQGGCFSGLKDRALERSGKDIYSLSDEQEPTSSISMGFWLPQQSLFGVPEREDTLQLKRTAGQPPYDIYATDHLHMPGTALPLYGSIPYVNGLNGEASSSILWINSAETTLDIDNAEYGNAEGSRVTFSSEAGAMEFFILGSAAKSENANRVSKVNYQLATVTGFAPMPLLYHLGYQFCKWAPISADMMMERNRNFTEFGFPIDVLWSDIEWAQQDSDPEGYEYFIFNPQNFTAPQISQMNEEIEASGRRITVIVDPHIKASEDYFVYAEGIKQQATGLNSTSVLPQNMFVRDENYDTFFGDCWPGNSTWLDFLNPLAQDYWGSLFDYSTFKGSNYLYSFWNDMNEPAVFNDIHTMPKTNVHFDSQGRQVQHREFHNAYGALHQRSSYRGLLKRDNDTRRPFVLTRSFFTGSQKFGTYWTGDNRAVFSEVNASMVMIMQLGNAGHPFGGSDVPGFYGIPTDDLWVIFYQMGMYYPFFRAHTHVDYQNREPWLQTQRVQTVIRDSINRRYDLIHYIYSTFEQTTKTGQPLVRAMWASYPDQTQFYDVTTQFMFGSSILVAPKVTRPDQVLASLHMQEVSYLLPENEVWYNYYSKQKNSKVGEWQTDVLSDLEQAVFVKAGSILPILLHDECMALMPCIQNAIRLEVYLADGDSATGSLYLDDGETLSYQSDPNASVSLDFTMQGTNLLSAKSASAATSEYKFGKDQKITEVAIFGFHSRPLDVLSNGVEVQYTYVPENEALYISDEYFAADLDNLAIEIVWN